MVKDRYDYIQQLKEQFPNIPEEDLRLILSIGDEEFFKFSDEALVAIETLNNDAISVINPPRKVNKANYSIFNMFKKNIFHKMSCMLRYMGIATNEYIYINIPSIDYLAYMSGFIDKIHKVVAYKHAILAELRKSTFDYTIKIKSPVKYGSNVFVLDELDLKDHMIIDRPEDKPISYFFNNNKNYRSYYGKDKKYVFGRS